MLHILKHSFGSTWTALWSTVCLWYDYTSPWQKGHLCTIVLTMQVSRPVFFLLSNHVSPLQNATLLSSCFFPNGQIYNDAIPLLALPVSSQLSPRIGANLLQHGVNLTVTGWWGGQRAWPNCQTRQQVTDKLELNWIHTSILQTSMVLPVQHRKRQKWNEDIRIIINVYKAVFPLRSKESQSPNI